MSLFKPPVTLLLLLAATTGCNGSHLPNFAHTTGLRSPVRNTDPLVSNRAEMTGYDPHNHVAVPANQPHLMPAKEQQRYRH